MNFGDQLNVQQSNEILDCATSEYGINFIVSFIYYLRLNVICHLKKLGYS